MYVCSLVKWPQGELLFITYMENFHILVKKKGTFMVYETKYLVQLGIAH